MHVWKPEGGEPEVAGEPPNKAQKRWGMYKNRTSLLGELLHLKKPHKKLLKVIENKITCML